MENINIEMPQDNDHQDQQVVEAVTPLANEIKQNPLSVNPWRLLDVIFITTGIGIFFVIGFVILYGIGFNFDSMSVLSGEPSLFFSIALGAIESLSIFFAVYLLGIRRRKYTWRAVWLNPLSKKWLIASILLGILAIPLSSLAAALVQEILGLPAENPQLEFLIPDGFSWIGLIGMTIIGGVCIPFTEELLFRGVYYRYFGKFGAWVGILVSSLIFAIAHGNIAISAAAFLLGVLLAWLYQSSRSLWAPVIVHAINNGVKIILIYILVAYNVDLTGI